MAADQIFESANTALSYQFNDPQLLRRAFTAGDSEDRDREGHRGMAQVGDALIDFVVKSEGYVRDVTRQSLQEIISSLRSKENCSRIAREHGFHRLVTISKRQAKDGPQPTVLKNTIAAIIGAVWLDSREINAVYQVMVHLGLFNDAQSFSMANSAVCGPPSPTLTCRTEKLSDTTAVSVETHTATSSAFERSVTPSQGDSITQDFYRSSFTGSADWFDFSNGVQFRFDSPQSGPHETGFETGFISGFSSDVGGTICPDPVALQSTCYDNLEVNCPNWFSLGEDSSGPMDYNLLGQDMHNVSDLSFDEQSYSHSEQSLPCSASDCVQSFGQLQFTSSESRRATSISDTEAVMLQPRAKHSAPSVPLTVKSQARIGVSDRRRAHRIDFKEYITENELKLQDQPEIFDRYYGHMKRYFAELCSIQRAKPEHNAKMAIAIGGYPAMLRLKEAIEGARKPQIEAAVPVGRLMPPEHRLIAIQNLDMHSARLNILRWLHIYLLYVESSRQVLGEENGGFQVLTAADVERTFSGGAPSAAYGNPRHAAKAQIAKYMAGYTNTDVTGTKESGKYIEKLKNLRRIGERLERLVSRWGRGILLILGPYMNDNIVLSGTNQAFNNFIKVVDKFEGNRIQALSRAAEPAVELFMENNEPRHTLRIEETAEEEIEHLPRLSEDIRRLFETMRA